jgi:hypothetical protein
MLLSFTQLPMYSHQTRQGMSVHVMSYVYGYIYIPGKHSFRVQTDLRSVVRFLLSSISPPALLTTLGNSRYSCLTFHIQFCLNFRCGLLSPSSISGHRQDIRIRVVALWEGLVCVSLTHRTRQAWFFLLYVVCYKGSTTHQVEQGVSNLYLCYQNIHICC